MERDMNNSLSLFRLQALFTRRAVIRRRLEQIEITLAEDETVKTADQARKTAIQTYETAQKLQSDHQTLMDERRLKKDLTHAQLFGGKVRSPKELQELELEEKNLNDLLARMEDEMMIQMASSDQAKTDLEAAQSTHQAAIDQKTSDSSLLLGERNKLQEELGPLGLQLKSLAKEIPADIFSEFQELLRIKKGRAVAEIFDGSCNACGMDLTPADLQLAKSSPKPIHCKNCGRMLFFKS
jgi:predicted  nucleic acid-binding Zn-ribbon protein